MKSLFKIFSIMLVSALAFSCGEKADPNDDKPLHERPAPETKPETPTEPSTPSTPTQPDTPAVQPGPAVQVKVVSFNVRYPASSDTGIQAWDYRFPGVCAMIETVAPDIIGTQECYISQRTAILNAFPKYKAYGIRRSDGKLEGDGSETTSIIYNAEKLELIEKGTFWLTEKDINQPNLGWSATIKRTTTWILFKEKTTEKYFYHFNTHLDHAASDAQIGGAKLIRAQIDALNTNKYPVVISGDMNVSQTSTACKEFKMGSVRQDAPKKDNAVTCHGYGGKYQQIDHIFYEFCTPIEFKTLSGPWNGLQYISDHHPVMAIVEM